MEYRRLGDTGLMVSELCLGCMTFGREADEEASRGLVARFLEAGGNFVDTADVYSKQQGKSAVPRGDAAARLETLLPALQKIGLFVVPVGEMEGFAPGVGGHGPPWVNAVLEEGLHQNGSLPNARTFIQTVAETSSTR